MRKHLLVLADLALCLLALSSVLADPLAAQTSTKPGAQIPDALNDSELTTLRVTTREVLVDLIALDRHNQAVLDLKPDELQVAESVEPEQKKDKKERNNPSITSGSVGTITSLSIFDPNNPASAQHPEHTGFRILASCLERSTVHYLLAFHPGPAGWTSGNHRISITTNRAETKLFYRHLYYVGLTTPAPDNHGLKQKKVDQLLQQSACYYPVTPLSVTLQARLIDTGRTDVVRYIVTVDAGSLSFLTINSDSNRRGLAGIDRRIELDYGTCNFDESGKPTSYFHAPVDQVLNSADYARAVDRGFPHILEFPASAHIALTRVVLRDRATGNMGAVDVTLPQLEHTPPLQGSSAAVQTAADLRVYQDLLRPAFVREGRQPFAWIRPVLGPIGSFGSIVPASHSFCGDVFELSGASDQLPDFRALDPIGSVYASFLDVPNQTFSNTTGIPGVTPRTNLFGVDYHGSFWVRTPGEYYFLMASDDGAILQIDDKQIIDLDGQHSVNAVSADINLDSGLHTIHVPYYQGAVDSVALELWVKPPGADKWAIFNLNEYQAPASSADVER